MKAGEGDGSGGLVVRCPSASRAEGQTRQGHRVPVRSMRARAKRRSPPALGNSVAQDVRFAEHDVSRSVRLLKNVRPGFSVFAE